MDSNSKKNVAIIVGALHGGGAERVAGFLSVKLAPIYNIFLILFDTNEMIYPYDGIILKVDYYDVRCIEQIREYKKKYNVYATISFLEFYNRYNILSRYNDKIIIAERNYNMNREEDLKTIDIYYKYADKIITVSKVIENEIRDRLDLKDEVTTAYNLVNINEIKKRSKEKKPLFVDEFIEDSPYIVAVGRLEEQKNFEYLISQFAKLKNMNTDIVEEPLMDISIDDLKLVIIGRGTLKEKLQNLIDELNLNKYIHIFDYLKNPFSIMRNAEVLILTSLYEGYPNVMVESFVLGVPVIASDCLTGPREIISGRIDYGNIEKDSFEVFDKGILYQHDNGGNNSSDALLNAIKFFFMNKDIQMSMRITLDNYSNEYQEDIKTWVNAIEDSRYSKKLFIESIVDRLYKVIIYGAGKSARIMYNYLKNNGYSIFCFAVSDMKSNT